MGKYKLPNGTILRKGQTALVPYSVISDARVHKLINTGRFAVVANAVTPSSVTEAPTDPPIPAPLDDTPQEVPHAVVVPHPEDEPIIKKGRRPRKKKSDID